MKYLSVCSGIEAATVAWHSLGWQPVGFSEIEPFPSAVLAHHYPHVPNFGDMTNFQEWPLDAGAIDLLVGGTPCQSFSVAGLRQGLRDPRGNLMLTYLAIAARLRPRWVVWENVPGVLSSNGGRDFGSFLGGLGQLGYGFAYQVLDAQWCRTHGHPRAGPQRRRRVFVVGCLGDATAAATVLLKQQSVLRNSKTRGTAREEIAADVEYNYDLCLRIIAETQEQLTNLSPVLTTDRLSNLNFLTFTGVDLDLFIEYKKQDKILQQEKERKEFLEKYEVYRGADWPDIQDENDFLRLPDWVKEECKIKFNFPRKLINRDIINAYLDKNN